MKRPEKGLSGVFPVFRQSSKYSSTAAWKELSSSSTDEPFYLDEDVDVLVASLLRSRGFEATTAHQAGQLGKTDAEQLEYAVSQRATILTHNRTDFEVLAREYFEQEKLHYGIIVVTLNYPNTLSRKRKQDYLGTRAIATTNFYNIFSNP